MPKLVFGFKRKACCAPQHLKCHLQSCISCEMTAFICTMIKQNALGSGLAAMATKLLPRSGALLPTLRASSSLNPLQPVARCFANCWRSNTLGLMLRPLRQGSLLCSWVLAENEPSVTPNSAAARLSNQSAAWLHKEEALL